MVLVSVGFLALSGWGAEEILNKEKEKQKSAMKDITTISTALADYLTDNGVIPQQNGIYSGGSDFYSSLSPFYVKVLPIKDPWGNNYRVYTGRACNGKYGISGAASDDFMVVSYGRDGEKELWEFNYKNPEGGFFTLENADDFDKNLMSWNGSWIRAPKTALEKAKEKADVKEIFKSTVKVSYSFPSWSPDGQKILFCSFYVEKGLVRTYKGTWEPSELVSRGDIYTINPDGSNEMLLSRREGRVDKNPLWSPNGRFILFERIFTNGENDKGEWVSCEIECPTTVYLMNADGTDLKEIPSRFKIYYYTWSPDGSKILYTGGYKETEGYGVPTLWVVNSDGTNSCLISDEESIGKGIYLNPCWSPDGLKIAYIRSSKESLKKEGKAILVIVDVQSRRKTDVVPIENFSFDTAHSDFQIRFVDNYRVGVPQDNNNLCFVPIDGKKEKTIINLGEGDEHTWSTDNSKIIYVYQGNIWIMNADATGKTQLTTSGLFNNAFGFSMSPLGNKIVFGRAGSIWLLSLEEVTEKIAEVLINRGKELCESDIDGSLWCFRQAIRYSESHKNNVGVLCLSIAENLLDKEKIDESLPFADLSYEALGDKFEKEAQSYTKKLSELRGLKPVRDIARGLEPVRAVGEIKPPKLIKRIEPVYPNIAREAGVEGTVILEATTDINGRVANVKVLRSIPILDQAAIDCVRQWVYEPMIIDGKPREVIFTITVVFKLK